WFAHPFFALDAARQIRVGLPAGCALTEPHGFTLDGRTLRLQQPFTGRDDGAFQPLQWPPDQDFDVSVAHPRLSEIRFTADFVPLECPIWANGHTFSIEPYQALQLEPVETRQWTLSYRLGLPR